MALVNDVKKEIHAKIVYFGPAQSGKTTNLEHIYGKLKPEYRGAFKFMNTSSGKIVFFDFMRPELAGIEDYSVRFHIYTAPGEVSVPAIWKNALKGADGIVFVADAEPSRMLENRRSLESLKGFLMEHGTKLGEVPCIFQCNKKDLADQSSLEQMKSLLDIDEFRMIPASARAGEAVLPTLSEMVKLILQKLKDLPAVQPEEKPAVGAESGMELSEPVRMPEPLLAETAEETFSSEPVEESFEPEVEPQEEETFVFEEEPEEEPLYLADQPAEETISFPLEAATGPDEGSFAPVFQEEPEEGIISESAAGTISQFTEPREFTAPDPLTSAARETEGSKPLILAAGEIETNVAGRFRMPLVIRIGDKEVKTALSIEVSFERPEP